MKRVYNLVAVTAIIGLAAFMAGCGGGSDDDDDAVGGGGVGVVAPASLGGQEVTITETGGAPQRVVFNVDGSTFTAFDGGAVVRTGTFDYTAANNTAVLTLRDADGSNPVTFNLTFSNTAAGTFAFIAPDGQSRTGSFSDLRASVGGGDPGGGDPGGGDPGGGDPGGGDPGGGDPGGGPTGPPASLNGVTLFVNAATGPIIGATTFNFGPGSTFTSSNTGGGNYSYTVTGNSATVILDYTSPADFAGDRDTFIMSFTPGTAAGTFTGSTRIANEESAHSGTFQIQ